MGHGLSHLPQSPPLPTASSTLRLSDLDHHIWVVIFLLIEFRES